MGGDVLGEGDGVRAVVYAQEAAGVVFVAEGGEEGAVSAA